MIVDVHSHCWPPGGFSAAFQANARRMRLSAVNLVTTVSETVSGLRDLCAVKIDRFALPRERIEELIHREALGIRQ